MKLKLKETMADLDSVVLLPFISLASDAGRTLFAISGCSAVSPPRFSDDCHCIASCRQLRTVTNCQVPIANCQLS